MAAIKDLLARLVEFQSITPHDAGCQEYMIDFFEQHGFICQRFNHKPVANFFARYGNKGPLLVFAGHTDVVPVGDRLKWRSDPFQLTEQDGLVYGRGVADMKGSLAAMMQMAARFVSDYPDFDGSLGFLITSGEEGDEFDLGTPLVMAALKQQGIVPDYCIVGEPSSSARLADVIKTGRRGSLSGKLTLQGKQGHVAYPHLAVNPIHLISPALAELTAMIWDNGNAHFPPTSLQITHINSGGHAGNIIPGELELAFNFRYSTEQTAAGLQQSVTELFNRHQLYPEIVWRVNGEPFLTAQGKLLDSCITAITETMGCQPELSTSGGTSDGRFIAPYGVEVIELGPINATIHQVNECVSMVDLEKLGELYYQICRLLLLASR
ncbi:succinyl-diaminopimelate desuccinylase [Legionella dresdenensis]|uniref:Succinyl-diaminopimelate desuccinylase n=1 Tax=Legionella dresdenensis TaxID=450200 RepID=A0ABV8CC82_9GAMM